MVPTICHCSIFLGVAPVMCATLSSDIKLPAIPMVVPMKDAIMRTAIIPTLPVMPAAVKHTAEMIIIKIVIPETGSVPVYAIELIPTTASKKDMIRTIKNATPVCARLSEYIKWKYTANKTVHNKMPAPIQDVGTSRCVRSKLTSVVLDVNISKTAFLTTLPTTLDMLKRPIIPAIASIPIPI